MSFCVLFHYTKLYSYLPIGHTYSYLPTGYTYSYIYIGIYPVYT